MRKQRPESEWPLQRGARVRLKDHVDSEFDETTAYTVAECDTFVHGECWYVRVAGATPHYWTRIYLVKEIPPLEQLAMTIDPRSEP
jgi:hypothetical protein